MLLNIPVDQLMSTIGNHGVFAVVRITPENAWIFDSTFEPYCRPMVTQSDTWRAHFEQNQVGLARLELCEPDINVTYRHIKVIGPHGSVLIDVPYSTRCDPNGNAIPKCGTTFMLLNGQGISYASRMLQGKNNLRNLRDTGLTPGFGMGSVDPIGAYFDPNGINLIAGYGELALRGVVMKEFVSTLGTQVEGVCGIVYPSANVFFGPDADYWYRVAPDHQYNGEYKPQFAVSFGSTESDLDVAINEFKPRNLWNYLGMMLQNPDGDMYLQVTSGYSSTPHFTPVGGIYDAFVPKYRPLIRDTQISLNDSGKEFLAINAALNEQVLQTACAESCGIIPNIFTLGIVSPQLSSPNKIRPMKAETKAPQTEVVVTKEDAIKSACVDPPKVSGVYYSEDNSCIDITFSVPVEAESLNEITITDSTKELIPGSASVIQDEPNKVRWSFAKPELPGIYSVRIKGVRSGDCSILMESEVELTITVE
jgi:hypothetical protein